MDLQISAGKELLPGAGGAAAIARAETETSGPSMGIMLKGNVCEMIKTRKPAAIRAFTHAFRGLLSDLL